MFKYNVQLRPLQVILLFLVRGIPLLCAGGWYIINTINNENRSTHVIASIFAHATSWKNCSTVLPGSPVCRIFHGIKKLCLEQQNTLTIRYQSLSHHREAVTLSENQKISWQSSWHYLLLSFTYKRINVSRSRLEYKIQLPSAKKLHPKWKEKKKTYSIV